MKKILLIYITLISYTLISILSSTNNVICIHKSGFTSFETVVNSDCVNLAQAFGQINKIAITSIRNEDKCYDTEILKGIITYQSSIFNKTVLSGNYIVTDYIRYIKSIDIQKSQAYYISNIKSNNFSEKSYCNHISTFVLLT